MLRPSSIIALFLGSAMAVQGQFSPGMPPGVPEVQGAVSEPFTLRYIEIAQGTGPLAEPGKQYTVHYTGWLRDGSKFDSSVDRNEPFQFVQGRRQVIAGWESGFEGMKVGGKRRLFIPYQMAYGERGRGKIPAKAELVFDVELLAVADAPQLAPAEDVLTPFRELEKKVLSLANAVPDDKYSYRPQPGVRSFGEVFLHIAYGNKLMLDLGTTGIQRNALMERIKAQLESERATVTKAFVVQKLSESFAEVAQAIEAQSSGSLGANVTFFGRNTTRRGVLVLLDCHVSEHLGQLIAYARVNGIKPPWSGSGEN